MPHFTFELNEDGTILQMLKDGNPYQKEVKLEQLFSIVTIYFKLAQHNLFQMTELERSDERRSYGLQAFLMSLTGLEAFINTYFHLRGRQLNNSKIVRRVAQSHGSLSKKISELIELSPDGPIHDQDQLIARIFELSQIRNDIVHPRWVPSSLIASGVSPISIQGLVENRQAMFEDEKLCREALFWCLLVVARIAAARNNKDVSGFMFHWTGNPGLTISVILQELNLPGDQ